MQRDFNREAVKISALLSRKIDKCKYLVGEEVLPPGRSRIREQARFTEAFGEARK